MTVADERHFAACAILETGQPFVLLLRTYGVAMPWRLNLQNEIYDRFSEVRIGVVSIRGVHPLADWEEVHPDPQLRARCPALSVETSDWRTVVGSLVDRASWLVCEVWSDTPGITDELLMSRESKREDDTVVLLPRPGYEDLRCYETFDGFWRLALYGDLEETALFDHPCTRALGLIDPRFAASAMRTERAKSFGDLSSRRGIPIVIPDLIALAFGYLETSQDWGSAAVHAQNAWNIGVRLAEINAPFSLEEREALIHGAVILAQRLCQFDRITDAIAKLDVALVFASDLELQHHSLLLKQLRQRIEEA